MERWRSHTAHLIFKGSPFVIVTAIGILDIRFEHWATQKQALDHRLSNEVSEVSRGTLMPVLLITPRTQVQAYFALISQ